MIDANPISEQEEFSWASLDLTANLKMGGQRELNDRIDDRAGPTGMGRPDDARRSAAPGHWPYECTTQ